MISTPPAAPGPPPRLVFLLKPIQPTYLPGTLRVQIAVHTHRYYKSNPILIVAYKAIEPHPPLVWYLPGTLVRFYQVPVRVIVDFPSTAAGFPEWPASLTIAPTRAFRLLLRNVGFRTRPRLCARRSASLPRSSPKKRCSISSEFSSISYSGVLIGLCPILSPSVRELITTPTL